MGTALMPELGRPRLPNEDGIGSLTSSLRSPLYLWRGCKHKRNEVNTQT